MWLHLKPCSSPAENGYEHRREQTSRAGWGWEESRLLAALVREIGVLPEHSFSPVGGRVIWTGNLQVSAEGRQVEKPFEAEGQRLSEIHT